MEAKQEATPNQIKDAATFLLRMLPALMRGQSLEVAGRAVLDQDRKLMLVATGDTEQGEAIRKHLAAQVFEQANVINFAERQVRIAADQKRLRALPKAGAT